MGRTRMHILVVRRGAFLAFLTACMGTAFSQEPDNSEIMRPLGKMAKITPMQFKAMAIVPPEAPGPQKLSPEQTVVWRFLAAKAVEFQLAPDVSNLKLTAVQSSLLGKHYHFQQVLGGFDVEGSTLVVSMDKEQNVTSVYSSMAPVGADKIARASMPAVRSEAALDQAWNALGAKADEKQGLFSEPAVELKYVQTKTAFRLAYAVDLHVNRKVADGPMEPGLWRVYVDAVTGEMIDQPEKRSLEHKRAENITYDRQADNRAQAFARFAASKTAVAAAVADEVVEKVSGKGLAFDPDPATTLKNATLADNSPPSAFEGAYQTVTLQEIAKRNGTHFLEGPWVKLGDFEAPFTSPSSRPDGNWTDKRGNNAFNDVMTYFHIDRSQRYIQSLGFTNIQAAPIVVDSDGLNGSDNSHFLPGSNMLSFGHGCVDDNEDADVILHEYGHAITHGVNPQWGGGDSRAIGEGFGDYWAETSSFASPNGSTFQVDTVFDFDAAGGCWPGRKLNVQPNQATYDHNRTYTDHQSIGNGVQSDELWSTPLYQAHLELRQANIAREDIDKIVLQSMFGLGSGFKMRQAAEKVVETAKALFPTGPHAGVFETQFKKLKILP